MQHHAITIPSLRRAALVLLAVSTLTGNPTPPAEEPPVQELPVQRWLDNWRVTRSCLVVPANDLDTGVALSLLRRRDCSKFLRELELGIPVIDDPLIRSWRQAISRLRRIEDSSAARRAAEIESIDADAQLLAARHQHPMFTVPKGAALPLVHDEATTHTRSFDVDEVTIRDGRDLVVVTPRRRYGWDAYVVAVSHDGGTSWRENQYDERIERVQRVGNAVEVISRRDNDFVVSQFTPSGRATELVRRLPNQAWHTCHFDDVVWGIAGTVVLRSDETGVHELGTSSAERITCGANGAVIVDPWHVSRCTDSCRVEFTNPLPDIVGTAGVLRDGRWAFALTLEHVTAVWIEGRSEPFYLRATSSIDWSGVFEGQLRLAGQVPSPLADALGRSHR